MKTILAVAAFVCVFHAVTAEAQYMPGAYWNPSTRSADPYSAYYNEFGPASNPWYYGYGYGNYGYVYGNRIGTNVYYNGYVPGRGYFNAQTYRNGNSSQTYFNWGW
jgi:hypothetical protein